MIIAAMALGALFGALAAAAVTPDNRWSLPRRSYCAVLGVVALAGFLALVASAR